MIRYFFLLRKTESGRQNQNSLPFLFMGKILSLLKRIKISKGEIKWKENILSTGFKSVLYINDPRRKKFWLGLSKHVQSFDLYGPQSVRLNLKMDKRISDYVDARFHKTDYYKG